MNNRLKMVRDSLSEQKGRKISRQKIADDLEVSLSNIESYEMGRRTPSNAFIKLFCNRYGVNESWLRTGTGDMFAPKDRETEIAEIASILFNSDDDFKAKLIRILIDMDETQIELLKDIACKIADATKDLP